MGLVRVRQGRLPEAADILGQAVAARPQEAQAHLNHGKVLAALGRHREAAGAFSSVVAMDPRHGEAMFGQGKALQAMGDLAGAIAAFRRCVALNPAHVAARLLLGPALIAAGQLAEAISAIEPPVVVKTRRGGYDDTEMSGQSRCAGPTQPGNRIVVVPCLCTIHDSLGRKEF